MSGMRLSKKDKTGLYVIIGTLVVLAMLFGVRALLPKKPLLDEKTMCPVKGEQYRSAILIDKSDKWGRSDVDRVKNLVLDIHRRVPFQGRLSLYAITGEERKNTKVDIVFDMCNPGSESECNALYQNCKKMRTTFKQAFDDPFAKMAQQLSMPGESSSSPILETIGTMIRDSHAARNDLFVISDFMENGATFRFYNLIPLDEEMVKAYPISADRNVSVVGYLIERRSNPIDLRNFVERAWLGYFGKQNVSAKIQPIFVTD